MSNSREKTLHPKSVFERLYDRRFVRRALLGALSIAFVLFSFKCIRSSINKTDSFVFFRAGQAVMEGQELYNLEQWRPLLNPPFFAIFMTPFSVFNLAGFSVVWYLFNIALLIGSLLFSVYLVRGKVKGAPAAMMALALLMIFRPIESNMTLGQSNLVIVFFALAGLVLFVRGSHFPGGVMLAVAISLKLTPGLFLIYFVYKRQWKMVGGIVAGTLFFSIMLPILVFGFDNAIYELGRWWDITHSSSLAVASAAKGFHVDGQTLRSLLFRLLTKSVISTKIDHTYVNIVSLNYQTAELITYAISGLMMGLLAWNFRGSLARQSRIVLALELALVFMSMTMFSPFSRKAHYVSLIVPSVAVLHYLYERGVSENCRKLLIAVVVSTIILITGSSRGIVGRTLSIYLSGYGIIFIGALILWGSLNFILFKERTSPRIRRRIVNRTESKEDHKVSHAS